MIKSEIIKQRLELRNSFKEIEERFKNHNDFIKDRRYKLLNKFSKAENHFKKLLTDKKIKFWREKIQETEKGKLYYTDFYIPSLNLNIEIDGKEHEKNKKYDFDKENKIYNLNGAITIRYTNEEVLKMDSISYKSFSNKIFEKYRHHDNRTTLSGRQWKIWKLNNDWIKNKEELKQNNYDGEYDKAIADSFDKNDLTVFVKSKCPKRDDYSEMEVFYKIFDKDQELTYFEDKISTHQFVSNNKSELLAIIKALEFISIEGGEGLKIKIFSHSKFSIDKLKSDWRFKFNPLSTYSDCMEEVNSLIDRFPYLTFEWLPKEKNLLTDENGK